MESRRSPLRRSYDRIAANYADRFADELAHKPFDRRFLDRLAGDISVPGWTVDLGSGPSQIGGYLATRGLQVLSIDLSLAMLHEARALRPDAACLQADMRALPVASQSLAAIVAFYSLIHIPQVDMAGTLGEIRRVLSPGGLLALAVHIGSETVHRDEMLGEAVDIDFFFFEPDRLVRDLNEAGFTIHDQQERDPNPAVEAETRRLYIVATP
jgi:SAM-dependent methyltransferase